MQFWSKRKGSIGEGCKAITTSNNGDTFTSYVTRRRTKKDKPIKRSEDHPGHNTSLVILQADSE
jgi:hypothetical protein